MAVIMTPGEQQSETDLLFAFLGNIGGVIGLVINPWFLIFQWGWGFVCAVLIIACSYKLAKHLGRWAASWRQ